MTTTTRTIEHLEERIRIAEADLARCPSFLKGSYYETSRIENLAGLRRSLERLKIRVEA